MPGTRPGQLILEYNDDAQLAAIYDRLMRRFAAGAMPPSVRPGNRSANVGAAPLVFKGAGFSWGAKALNGQPTLSTCLGGGCARLAGQNQGLRPTKRSRSSRETIDTG